MRSRTLNVFAAACHLVLTSPCPENLYQASRRLDENNSYPPSLPIASEPIADAQSVARHRCRRLHLPRLSRRHRRALPGTGPQSRRQPGLEQPGFCGLLDHLGGRGGGRRSRRRTVRHHRRPDRAGGTAGACGAGPAGGGVPRGSGSAGRSFSPATCWRCSPRSPLAMDGYCVVAGTGAGAIRIRGGEIDRVVDLAGWQLGDLGSGYWLGHEAAKAAVAEMEGRGPATALTPALLEALSIADAGEGTARAARCRCGSSSTRSTPCAPSSSPALRRWSSRNRDDPVAAQLLDAGRALSRSSTSRPPSMPRCRARSCWAAASCLISPACRRRSPRSCARRGTSPISTSPPMASVGAIVLAHARGRDHRRCGDVRDHRGVGRRAQGPRRLRPRSRVLEVVHPQVQRARHRVGGEILLQLRRRRRAAQRGFQPSPPQPDPEVGEQASRPRGSWRTGG